MFATARCCAAVTRQHGVLPMKKSVVQAVTGCGRNKHNKGSCCKDIAQTEGKTIEPWPKSDPPPPAWRCTCPTEPQLPNYDPYRIKVPDIVVPPLPPSNAKRAVVLSSQSEDQQNQCQQGCQQGYGCEQQGEQQEEPTEEGFVGALKRWFGLGKDKEKKGSDQMMPMLDCSKTKGPCSVRPVPPAPPCTPPPPKPFPWIYVWVVTGFFALMGSIYRLHLYREELKKKIEIPLWRPRRKVKRPYHDKDLPACVQYLIVGAGAAGWAAYRAIMEHDKTAKVFFISKEDSIPYIRPPMSKYMWWNQEPPDIGKLNYLDKMGKRTTMYLAECKNFMDPVKFYRKKTGPAVSIATGWCVLRVDAENHIAYIKTMCGEQPMYYERCLLAPGSKAKNLSIFTKAPKAVRERVVTLRTIRDLETAYRKVKAARHVVIVGGGVLGCELTWHLGKMNEVVNIERRKRNKEDQEPIQFVFMYKDKGVMSSILPEYLGEWAAEKIRCQSVQLMAKTQVHDAFPSPDGRLELTLSNGSSLVTDLVLVAVGSEPRVEMAEPSYLEQDAVNGGFLVNTELEARTHLYVAGDAASFYSQWKDHRLRIEHYDNAEEQGRVAGANMTGYWTPCNTEPHFELELGDQMHMEVVGEVGACMPTVGLFKPCAEEAQPKVQKRETGSGDQPCFKKTEEYQNRYKRGLLFYLRDETVVGMVFWNMPPIEDRREVATELLRAEPSYKDISLLAELVGFGDTECTYVTADQLVEPGPCIKNWRVF